MAGRVLVLRSSAEHWHDALRTAYKAAIAASVLLLVMAAGAGAQPYSIELDLNGVLGNGPDFNHVIRPQPFALTRE